MRTRGKLVAIGYAEAGALSSSGGDRISVYASSSSLDAWLLSSPTRLVLGEGGLGGCENLLGSLATKRREAPEQDCKTGAKGGGGASAVRVLWAPGRDLKSEGRLAASRTVVRSPQWGYVCGGVASERGDWGRWYLRAHCACSAWVFIP